MLKEHKDDLKERAENCEAKARLAMDRAEKLPERERAEYLTIAVELLKLAAEIRALLSRNEQQEPA